MRRLWRGGGCGAPRAAMKFPGSVLVSLVLFVAETAAALCLSGAYGAAGDRMWRWLTLLFALLPCALVQLSLVFIHRDVSRDRPLVLLLHLLQLGPLVRSVSPAPPRPAAPSRLGAPAGGPPRCHRAGRGGRSAPALGPAGRVRGRRRPLLCTGVSRGRVPPGLISE